MLGMSCRCPVALARRRSVVELLAGRHAARDVREARPVHDLPCEVSPQVYLKVAGGDVTLMSEQDEHKAWLTFAAIMAALLLVVVSVQVVQTSRGFGVPSRSDRDG